MTRPDGRPPPGREGGRRPRIADRVVITQIRELTDDDYRELARIIRRVHARTAVRHERERLAAGAGPCQCEVCETRKEGM